MALSVVDHATNMQDPLQIVANYCITISADPETRFLRDSCALSQYFVLPLHRSKHYKKYTLQIVDVLGIWGPGTYLARILPYT